MRAPLRVAVVGAGQMGVHHLRVYSRLKGVELVAVVDSDVERAERAAAEYGCRAEPALEDLVGKIDAASVAVPSSLHAEVGGFLLGEGVHCLIEKPLAVTEAECQALIAAAESGGVVLLVGHVERFNPVVQQLVDIVGQAVVHAIDVRRMSTVSARVADVDVITDLMVHDLDIVAALMDGDVTDIAARGVRIGAATGPDYVTALLSFASGSIASLTASRITHNKIRELQVTADIGFITANYSTQELLVYRQGEVSMLEPASSQSNYALDLAIERLLVRAGEPLLLEIQHFVDAITDGVTPIVNGHDALAALRLVWQIQDELSVSLVGSDV